MKTPCYEQLRTTEQLGYLVWSFARSTFGIRSMNILIQSGTHSPRDLSCRVNAFLVGFRRTVEKLADRNPGSSTKSEWDQFLTTLQLEYRKKDVSMSDAFNRFWGEIDNETFEPMFDRVRQLCKIVPSLTPDDLLKFYNEMIAQSTGMVGENSRARKFSVEVYGPQHAEKLLAQTEGEEGNYTRGGAESALTPSDSCETTMHTITHHLFVSERLSLQGIDAWKSDKEFFPI
jgi:insulysin